MHSNTSIPQSGFVSKKWLLKRYDISNSTLYKWIADGRLERPVKIGPRAVRFRMESILAFEERLLADKKEGE
jgi:predicted DNA-binding transcriptional regulator AlpA